MHTLTKKQLYMVTGLALIIMALASIWAYGLVFTSLYVEGNPVETATRIDHNALKFATGNAAWLLILVADLVVAWGLYLVLKTNQAVLSLSAMILRLVYTLFLAYGIGQLCLKNLGGFMVTWHWGLIVFGLHLILLGSLRFVSKAGIPWALSALLIIAGVGYSLVHFMFAFMPESLALAKQIETVFLLPMSISELLLAAWLIIKGRASA